MKSGGPALLFEHVQRSSMPLRINAFGSAQRIGWALGIDDLEQHADRIRKLVAMAPPGDLVGKLRALGDLREIAGASPRLVGSGPCQEVVVPEPSFQQLPVLTCWPDDGGPFITLGQVFTRDPRTGRRNVGLYRIQVFNDREAAMHWQLHKGGAEHYRSAEHRLEVAVAIGADPATVYAASAPLPPAID